MGALATFRRILASRRVRRFDAAGAGRRWDSRLAFGRTGPETLAASAPIRSRARHCYANNPYARNGIDAHVIAAVGFGIKTVSAHRDAEMREACGAFFARWSERADADGRTTLAGLQREIVRALKVDGEAFAVMESGLDGMPRLRIIPAELVDESYTRDLDGGGYAVAGVEFNGSGERVAYHIFQDRPTDVFASLRPAERVPAGRVLHIIEPLGAGQVRGVSALAPVLLRLSELDQLEDALLVKEKVSAMMMAFLVDTNGTGAESPFDGEGAGAILESGLEPGTMKFLPSGWDVRLSQPQQAAQSAEFLAHQIRAVAAGLGVPVHLVDGNLAQANYSSLRAGSVAFRQRVEALQWTILAPQFLSPVWEAVITAGILSGRLDAPNFESAADDYLACEHFPPPLPWVDPKKDIEAEELAIKAGLKSRRQAVAERGFSIEALDAERAADAKRERELQLITGTEGASDAA
ncbi:MAG: phage portal protein [Alphaproteobacteria bacterium]|nr:phage portal protein [Alphaproteobacteria bacterium]